MRSHILFGCSLVLFCGSLLGQNKNLTGDGVQSTLIPPLGVLLDSAYQHSPALHGQETMIKMREFQVKSQKLDWTKNIEGFSEWRYGSFDYVTISQSGATIGTDQNVSNRFNVGTRIMLNGLDLINHGRKVKIAKEQLKYEEFKFNEMKQMIAREVIKLWNMLITFERIIDLKAKHQTTQKINLQVAEKQFVSGEITIDELSRVSEVMHNADEEFELTKQQFREAYMLLEEIVGVSLSDITRQRR